MNAAPVNYYAEKEIESAHEPPQKRKAVGPKVGGTKVKKVKRRPSTATKPTFMAINKIGKESKNVGYKTSETIILGTISDLMAAAEAVTTDGAHDFM